MPKYLTDRQDRKLQEIINKVDGGVREQPQRKSNSFDYVGTDNGFIGVPATTISAKSQTSGSATLGSGTAWVYKIGFGGALEEWNDPRKDPGGPEDPQMVLSVFNSTSTAFLPSGTSNKIEADTPLLQIDQLRDSRFAVSPFGENSTTPVRLLKAYATQDIQDRQTGTISVLEASQVVQAVSQANPAVVTTGSPHGYTTGNTVRVKAEFATNLSSGMIQLSAWTDYSITVTSPTTFTIPVDTTSFQAWTTGTCARTNSAIGVNQFCHVGRMLFEHTELYVQPRQEDGNFDIVHPPWDGPTRVFTEETIAKQARGNATISDSQLRIRLEEALLPDNTHISNLADAAAYYWKTVPPDVSEGVAGRPYVYKLVNLNCDDLLDGQP